MVSIKPLSESVINKISAGEVIERPASVVKELLENSLDAGAQKIDIEIEEGGRKKILVRDNGEGIRPEELRLAVARHATSKLKDEADLFSIKTLGFRGEAIASIAAVSKFSITSRFFDGNSSARQIVVEGGKIVSEHDAGHPVGTSVCADNLFYQTPARLKFLKSTATEITHIADHVIRIALSHPGVAFRLKHNGKKMVSTEATTSLTQKISDLFGGETARNCFEIISPPLSHHSSLFLSVSGLVGHPQISRSHQKNIFIIVNGRGVRDKVIYHAILQAHRNLLMHQKYPFVVLDLQLPSDMVDVNVHPTKSEVRFSDANFVHRMVYDSLRKTLEGEPWKEKERESRGPGDESFSSIRIVNDFAPSLSSSVTSSLDQELKTSDHSLTTWPMESKPKTDEKEIQYNSIPYSHLKVIGQLMGTYLVCEGAASQGGQKLVLIDQHAAHERIGFEKLCRQMKEGQVVSQNLLIPISIDLKPTDVDILKIHAPSIKSFGFDIEFFGGSTFIIRAVPCLLMDKVNFKDLILDLIGDILEKGKLVSLNDRVDEVLARMACHGAIRANHPLTHVEIQALLGELDQHPHTSFCPHGRPVAVDVQKGELERWFKRIV